MRDKLHISNSFRGCCKFMEVDDRCLTGFDFSPLRIVLAVHDRRNVPSEL